MTKARNSNPTLNQNDTGKTEVSQYGSEHRRTKAIPDRNAKNRSQTRGRDIWWM